MYDFQTKPTPEKLSKILSYIDANNYDLWVMVSLVLGREYPNNQEVLNILHQWSATASNRKHKDDRKEEKNFLDASSGRANSGKQATLATIINIAKSNGYFINSTIQKKK